jgi:hypothetical protein
MQTRDNNKKQAEETRDLELENIVGNLLIAEYQVDRLQTRLVDIVHGYRREMSGAKTSAHIFKHNDKWYKLSLKIDEANATS